MIAAMAKTLPRNADVAEQLDLLADILELEGEAAYRLLAYRRAAALVREQPGLVAEMSSSRACRASGRRRRARSGRSSGSPRSPT